VNHVVYALLLLITNPLFVGCTDTYRGAYLDRRSPERVLASVSRGIIPEAAPRRWHSGNREFFDNNGDGRIDCEVVSVEGYWGSDGYGRFKIDKDYDGFYDEEREQGGIGGELRWSRPIHEAVPAIHRGMIPGPLYP